MPKLAILDPALDLLELPTPRVILENAPDIERKLAEIDTAVKNVKLALACFGLVDATDVYEVLVLRMELDSLLKKRLGSMRRPTLH